MVVGNHAAPRPSLPEDNSSSAHSLTPESHQDCVQPMATSLLAWVALPVFHQVAKTGSLSEPQLGVGQSSCLGLEGKPAKKTRVEMVTAAILLLG